VAEINAAYEQERVREQAKAAVTAYRAMLDTFVNNPAPRNASQAGQVRPQQPQGPQPQPTNAK
jgi:hypothetical protein